jgi:multidrug transporter EmrE-like cation transporter
MSDFTSHCLIMLAGVIIAALSQFILKKAATREYKRFIDQYLNWRVVVGYGMMVLSTFCTIIAQRVIPLSMSPIWDACSQIFVLSIGFFILHESLTKRKLTGVALMLAGILIFLIR